MHPVIAHVVIICPSPIAVIKMDLNPNKAPPTKRQSTLFGAIAVAREKKKRKRRTNQELRRDSNAKNASLGTLARNLGSFVTRTTSNITTAISAWEKI